MDRPLELTVIGNLPIETSRYVMRKIGYISKLTQIYMVSKDPEEILAKLAESAKKVRKHSYTEPIETSDGFPWIGGLIVHFDSQDSLEEFIVGLPPVKNGEPERPLVVFATPDFDDLSINNMIGWIAHYSQQ